MAISKRAAVAPVEPEKQQFLTFLLGGEPFAISILVIKEIIEYGQLTAVPLMPDFIRGVLNLRGQVLPVIDLAARFGRAQAEVARRTCIVIIEIDNDGEKQDVGIIVDSVSEVMDIAADMIQPAPAFGAKIRVDFIDGMVEIDGRFIIILNVDRVLSIDEMTLLASIDEDVEEATAAAQ
ncbi:MAG: cheW 3 [Verrucomicrobiaceae bacterium]|nr:cheW 3 [Verrucomicrobiaceae bacterium]